MSRAKEFRPHPDKPHFDWGAITGWRAFRKFIMSDYGPSKPSTPYTKPEATQAEPKKGRAAYGDGKFKPSITTDADGAIQLPVDPQDLKELARIRSMLGYMAPEAGTGGTTPLPSRKSDTPHSRQVEDEGLRVALRHKQ